MKVSDFGSNRGGRSGVEIILSRHLPDATPANVFDDYRFIENSFGFLIGFDLTKAESAVDIPRLRSALDSFVNTTMLNRLIAGEH